VISDRWDVVLVPFPFSEGHGTKRRPALALSSPAFNRAGHTILAMITIREHNPWLGDTEIEEHRAAGLPLRCLVRLKLFTLDNHLILRRLGSLAASDAARVEQNFTRYLP